MNRTSRSGCRGPVEVLNQTFHAIAALILPRCFGTVRAREDLLFNRAQHGRTKGDPLFSDSVRDRRRRVFRVRGLPDAGAAIRI